MADFYQTKLPLTGDLHHQERCVGQFRVLPIRAWPALLPEGLGQRKRSFEMRYKSIRAKNVGLPAGLAAILIVTACGGGSGEPTVHDSTGSSAGSPTAEAAARRGGSITVLEDKG